MRWWWFALLLGCKTSDPPSDSADEVTTPDLPVDADGDGWTVDEDCDDLDGSVNPGRTDHCDGEDNDCDGLIDEDASTLGAFWPDEDGDGFGQEGVDPMDCLPQSGDWASQGGDCDDDDVTIHPDAPDSACNGMDDDCDGSIDEDYRQGYRLISMTNTHIQDLNPITGAVLDSRPLVGPTYYAASTTLSEADLGLAYANAPAPSALASFDACTGNIQIVSNPPYSKVGALSFGIDQRLFALDGDQDVLVELDPQTGASSTIGALDRSIGNSGIAYDCSTETLYGIDADSDTLFKIDVSNATTFDAVALPADFETVGLAFHHQTRLLLATTGKSYWTIDPVYGTATQVADWVGTDLEDANDLAFFPQCQP